MSTPITKTLVIKAGETGIFPTNGKIVNVYTEGNASASSACIKLPAPSVFKCYEMYWSIENAGVSHTGPWSLNTPGDIVIQELRVGDQIYPLNLPGDGGACKPQCSTLFKFIQQNVPESLMKIYAHDWDPVGDRHDIHLKFKAAPEVIATTYLKFGGSGGVKNTYVYPLECATCCPDPPVIGA